MGARFLRLGGATCLVLGAVLVVSGAAWSVPDVGSEVGAGIGERVGTLVAPLQEPAGEGDESEAEGDSEDRAAYITKTCERIVGQPPTGGLDKTTDPPDGSAVDPGDEIEVTLTWDPDSWSGDSLHKTIDCVTVNDSLVLDLTVEERPTANDGVFTTTYAVPDDLLAGDELCDQGFLSGDTPGGEFGQDRSNQVCFTVEEGSETESGTVTESPPESSPPDAAPPEEALPSSPNPGTEVLGEQLVEPATPQEATPRQPTEVMPEMAGPPAPDVGGDTLPRTGREIRRGFMLAGGIVLMVGGFGIIGGTRRPRRALTPA